MGTPIINTQWFNDANLKAYYQFSVGALTTDSSGEGHTLTAISDPAEDASGKFGGAVALDGNDAYSADDHADFKPTGVFSVGGWVRTSSSGFVFQSYSRNTNRAGILIVIVEVSGFVAFHSGKNTGTTLGTDYQVITGTTNVADGNWHFIVGTWDGSYLRIYVDGVSDADPVAWDNAPAYAATNYVRVGCENRSGTNQTFFTGSLDDVFLMNGTALTAAQIKNIYTGVAPSLLMNLAVYWKNN
jgi:large repetitive protein